MPAREVILRIVGDNLDAMRKVAETTAAGDKINDERPTLHIEADASAAMDKMAAFRAAVAALTDKMNDVKFGVNDTEFDARLAAMMAKLVAFQRFSNLPGFRVSDQRLAQNKADLLSLAASYDRLIASQERAAAAAKKAADADVAGIEREIAASKALQAEAARVAQIEAIRAAERNDSLWASYNKADAEMMGVAKGNYDKSVALLPGWKSGAGGGTPPGAGLFGMPAVPLFGGLAVAGGTHVMVDGLAELTASLGSALIAAAAFGAALTALAPTADMIYQREVAMYTATDVAGHNFPLLTSRLNQFGQMVPVTATSLNQLNAQFRPGVVSVWGDALTIASNGGGLLTHLLQQAVPWLDQFAAKLTVDMTNGTGSFQKLVQDGAHYLGLFMGIIGNVGRVLGDLFKVSEQTHIASDLLTVVDAFTHLAAVVMGNPIVRDIAAIGLGLHGLYLWGGMAVTPIISLLGVLGKIPGLGALKVFQDLPGSLDKLAQKGLEASDSLMMVSTKGLKSTAVAADGSIKEIGRFGTLMGALGEIPVVGWAALAAVAIGAIGLAFINTTSDVDRFISRINKSIASAGNANVFNVMASSVGQVNNQLKTMPGVSSAAQNALHGAASSGKDFYDTIQAGAQSAIGAQSKYGAENTRILGQMTNFGVNVTWLMKTFGVSYPIAIDIANKAGVDLTKNMQGNSKQAQDLRQQIMGLVGGFQQLQGPTGIDGKNFEALAIASNDITQKISQLNSAWHQMVSTVSGPQTSLDTFAQGLDVLNSSSSTFTEHLGILEVRGKGSKTAIDSMTQAGVNLNQAFAQEVSNLDQYEASLRSSGASQAVQTQAVKAGVAALIPYASGSKEATAQLSLLAQEVNGPTTTSIKTLANWAGVKAADALGIMKKKSDDATIGASNLANALQNLLNAQFQQDIIKTSGASADLEKYTSDLVNNKAQTAQGRTDRQNLINDVAKVTGNYQTATQWVNNLTSGQTGLNKAISSMPVNKTANVFMNGKGQYTISGLSALVNPNSSNSFLPTPTGRVGGLSSGALVPGGYGGGDHVAALLEPGEAVVPKHLTKYVAPFLSAHNVPGFASGGVAGSGSYSGPIGGMSGFTTNMYNTFQSGFSNAMTAAMKSGILQASSALNFTGGAAASGTAAAAQAFARSMLGAYGWGLNQWPSLLALWNRESGWNANAVNHASGAYGIPQSLGHGHPFNLGDYANQVRWGLAYIFSRYGSPAAAWGHEVSQGWYDNGGLLMPGLTLAYNGTGHPEMVTNLSHPHAGNYGGGGGGDIYITVQAGDCIDPNAVAQAIHQRLRRYKQKKGNASLGLD